MRVRRPARWCKSLRRIVRGLLHRIGSCLSHEQCNIEIALIDTEGQMAIDTFYLTSGGKKLTVEHQKKVEKALIDELKSLELSGSGAAR